MRKFDKNVPKPGGSGNGTSALDVRLKELRSMLVGDSFKFPASEVQLRRSDINRLHIEQGQKKRWSCYKMSPEEYRIWRDA